MLNTEYGSEEVQNEEILTLIEMAYQEIYFFHVHSMMMNVIISKYSSHFFHCALFESVKNMPCGWLEKIDN